MNELIGKTAGGTRPCACYARLCDWYGERRSGAPLTDYVAVIGKFATSAWVADASDGRLQFSELCDVMLNRAQLHAERGCAPKKGTASGLHRLSKPSGA